MFTLLGRSLSAAGVGGNRGKPELNERQDMNVFGLQRPQDSVALIVGEQGEALQQEVKAISLHRNEWCVRLVGRMLRRFTSFQCFSLDGLLGLQELVGGG